MTEKPTNVRVHEAIGLTAVYVPELAGAVDGPWVAKKWTNAHQSLPDYEHSIAAAFVALEAWRKMGDRSVVVGIARSGYCWCEILNETPQLFRRQADSLPAAICQAILAACEKEAGR